MKDELHKDLRPSFNASVGIATCSSPFGLSWANVPRSDKSRCRLKT